MGQTRAHTLRLMEGLLGAGAMQSLFRNTRPCGTRAQPRSTKLTEKSRRKGLKSLPAGVFEPAAADCRLMSMMVGGEERREKKIAQAIKGRRTDKNYAVSVV